MSSFGSWFPIGASSPPGWHTTFPRKVACVPSSLSADAGKKMAMTYATRAEAGSSLLKAMSGGYRRYIKNKKPFVEILYERLFYGAQGICTIHAEKQITPFDGLSAFCFSHLPARIFLTVFFSMLRFSYTLIPPLPTGAWARRPTLITGSAGRWKYRII